MTGTRELEGKVAIVTGAGRNIGRAMALALADGGASVVVNARSNHAEAEAVAHEIEAAGGKALVHIGDIADATAVQAMADAAMNRFGRIDILVNNAALRREKPFDEITFAEWREVMDVILDGTQMEKFDALSLISKRYAPAVAPALKRVLEDKDGSVRVLAATVMARQHNGYTRRIGERQAIARATPDDPNGWSALARAHLDYVGSGLLEESRAETERAQARIHLDRSERLCRGDVASRLEAQTPRETGDTA